MELFAEVDYHLNDFRLLDVESNHFLGIFETRCDNLYSFCCDDDLNNRNSWNFVPPKWSGLTFSFESNLYDPMRMVRQEKLVE